MPVSAIVGKREIMQNFDEVFFSFTFGGETASLAAAIATIKEIREKDAIAHFWRQGGKLKEGYNELAKSFGLTKYTQCIGLPAYNSIYFRDANGKDSLELKSLFQQEMIKRGVLTIGVHLLCLSHSDEDIKKTLEAYDDTLKILRQAIDDGNIDKYLEGKKLHPVLRRRT